MWFRPKELSDRRQWPDKRNSRYFVSQEMHCLFLLHFPSFVFWSTLYFFPIWVFVSSFSYIPLSKSLGQVIDSVVSNIYLWHRQFPLPLQSSPSFYQMRDKMSLLCQYLILDPLRAATFLFFSVFFLLFRYVSEPKSKHWVTGRWNTSHPASFASKSHY